MIVFDASAVVSAALKVDGTPERALLWANQHEVFALSVAVDTEISNVLSRSRFAASISPARRASILGILRNRAAWWSPEEVVTDCRDAKDNKYLELALASKAEIIVSGDNDLLVLHPWRGVLILPPAEYLAGKFVPS